MRIGWRIGRRLTHRPKLERRDEDRRWTWPQRAKATRESDAGIAGRLLGPRPAVPLLQTTNRPEWARRRVRRLQLGIPRMRRWPVWLLSVSVWPGGSGRHAQNRKLTAHDDTRDRLADGPHTFRNTRSKFLDNAREIVTHDSAILALLENTSKSLPYIRSDDKRNAEASKSCSPSEEKESTAN